MTTLQPKKESDLFSFRSKQGEVFARMWVRLTGWPQTFLDETGKRWVIKDPSKPPILDLEVISTEIIEEIEAPEESKSD